MSVLGLKVWTSTFDLGDSRTKLLLDFHLLSELARACQKVAGVMLVSVVVYLLYRLGTAKRFHSFDHILHNRRMLHTYDGTRRHHVPWCSSWGR